MCTKLWLLLIAATISVSSFQTFAQEGNGMEEKLPPPRNIPGITSEDNFPNACVDCHLNYTEMNMDTRFSTLIKLWNEKVDSALLAKAQASAPEGLVLKGKHPNSPKSFNNVPQECLTCHKKDTKIAPPFAGMIHKIHLTGGEQNHFLTIFQGECTYCHKLNSTTGRWTIPSGPEH